MKKQAVCEYCGQVFEEVTNDEGFDNDYKQLCVKHEITHLNLEQQFRANLAHALNFLDQKYGDVSTINEINVSACWDSYYGKDVTYNFKGYSTKMKKSIGVQFEVQYRDKEQVPNSEEIIKQLEHNFFIPTINQKYEGVFTFEGYCGGNGADDFMIGDSYMKTIFRAFEGKKVKLEVID